MKTIFRFIKFDKKDLSNEYWILSRKNGAILGEITYYREWGKWVFNATNDDIVFDAVCLEDILTFIKQL